MNKIISGSSMLLSLTPKILDFIKGLFNLKSKYKLNKIKKNIDNFYQTNKNGDSFSLDQIISTTCNQKDKPTVRNYIVELESEGRLHRVKVDGTPDRWRKTKNF